MSSLDAAGFIGHMRCTVEELTEAFGENHQSDFLWLTELHKEIFHPTAPKKPRLVNPPPSPLELSPGFSLANRCINEQSSIFPNHANAPPRPPLCLPHPTQHDNLLPPSPNSVSHPTALLA